MPEAQSVEQSVSITAESRTGQHRIELAQTGESCLQECGYQARAGLYTDCLANGGERKSVVQRHESGIVIVCKPSVPKKKFNWTIVGQTVVWMRSWFSNSV